MEHHIPEDDRLFKVDEMPYVHNYQNILFCILRCDRKYKDIKGIKGFIKHMERLQETPNADKERTDLNLQVYGAEDLYKDTEDYLSDCKKYKTSTVGRDLMLTCTPQFFKGMSEKEQHEWINWNVEWLKQYFGDNFRYCCAHYDETTLHLHALIVPKQWSEKKKCYTLQSYIYFNGPAKLRKMQDSYAEHMAKKYSILQRGIKNSRAKNIAIKTFYGLITKDLDENDIESIKAHARNSHLIGIKNKRLERLLKMYRDAHIEDIVSNDKLKKENTDLKNQLTLLEKQYKDVVDRFAKNNDLKSTEAVRVLDHLKENDKIRDILKTKYSNKEKER